MHKLDDLELRFLREREDHAATQGFLGGVLLGTLLGVVLTLVFAPRRGEETRAAVAHKAVEAKDKAVDLAHHAMPFKGTDDAAEESGPGHEAAIERDILAANEPQAAASV